MTRHQTESTKKRDEFVAKLINLKVDDLPLKDVVKTMEKLQNLAWMLHEKLKMIETRLNDVGKV